MVLQESMVRELTGSVVPLAALAAQTWGEDLAPGEWRGLPYPRTGVDHAVTAAGVATSSGARGGPWTRPAGTAPPQPHGDDQRASLLGCATGRPTTGSAWSEV